MNRAGSFPGGAALANCPGAILFTANGQKGDIPRLFESPQKQALRILQIFTARDDDWLVGEKAMGRDGLKSFLAQSSLGNELIAFQ